MINTLSLEHHYHQHRARPIDRQHGLSHHDHVILSTALVASSYTHHAHLPSTYPYRRHHRLTTTHTRLTTHPTRTSPPSLNDHCTSTATRTCRICCLNPNLSPMLTCNRPMHACLCVPASVRLPMHACLCMPAYACLPRHACLGMHAYACLPMHTCLCMSACACLPLRCPCMPTHA